MFCPKCGTSVADAATVCTSCHSPLALAAAAAAPAGAPSSAAAGAVRSAVADALATLRTCASDPVGGPPRAYASLGEPRALRAGLAFGVLSLACFLAGGYLALPPFLREDLFEFLGFGGVVKCLLFATVPFACTAAGSVAVRKALGGEKGTGLGGDTLIAGIALVPVSLAMLLSSLLGIANAEVVGLLAVFAGCTAVLALFSGYTRITGLSERAGALAVPVVIVLAAWLAKVIAASVLSPSGGPEEMPFVFPY